MTTTSKAGRPGAATPTGGAPQSDSLGPAEDSFKGTPHRKRNLTLVGAAMAVDTGESNIIITLFPLIARTFGLNEGALGLISGVARLSSAIGGPFWVWAAKKTSRKFALSVASGIWGVWAIAAGLSTEYWMLFVFYVVSAFGPAAAQAIVPEVIGDSFPEKLRGRVVGNLFGALGLFNGALAPLIGQLSGVEDGWRYGFFIFGGTMIIAGILIALFYRDPGTGAADAQLRDLPQATRDLESRVTRAKLAALLRTPSVLVIAISRFATTSGLIVTFGITLLVQDFHINPAIATTVIAAWAAGFLLGNVGGGVFSDRIEKRFPGTGRIMMMQVGQLLVAASIFFTAMFDHGSIGPYAALYACIGLSMGLIAPLNRPFIMGLVAPELRGSAFALLTGAEALGAAISSIAAGFIAVAIGLPAMLVWVGVVVMVVNTAFLTVLYSTFRRDRQAFLTGMEARRARLIATID